MAGFLVPEDIASRGLQHCRLQRISAFSDHNANAQETAFVYDKLRKAELQRNVWTFATKRVILRPLATTTLLWTPAAFVSATTYAQGAIVTYGGDWWQSKVGTNLGHTPAPEAYWQHYSGNDSLDTYDSTIHYFAGELVKSGSAYYLSLVTNNTDAPPTSNWLSVGGTSVALSILYPIGSGPVSNLTTRNVFRKPHGYLRQAPTDPKAGMPYPWLGVRLSPLQDDYVFEGDYVVSSSAGAMLLRYVSDFVDVPDMDPMFCEGLAARIAVEIAPSLVQNPALVATIMANAERHYHREMFEARLVNNIEAGPEQTPLDEYIAVRF